MDALLLRSRVKGAGLSERLAHLTGTALRIAIEHPPGWEYLLFGHSLAQQISGIREQEFDLNYGVVLAGRAFRRTCGNFRLDY